MKSLSWFTIFRLGLVQTALGSVVVLMTSTLNRVMGVELNLFLTLPASLVALHSAVQVSRPLWGHLSDRGRRVPWIILGMGVLGFGGTGASYATATMNSNLALGITIAIVSYTLVGIGVGAAGTSLLALLAARVQPDRKAPAAAVVWLMMIAGFVVTTGVAGRLLDVEPFSFERLVMVCTGVSIVAFLVSCVALIGVESSASSRESAETAPKEEESRPPFREVFQEVWADSDARAFTIFVFVSMLAYNTQDIILEPFAGAVFDFNAGASTRLTSVQYTGVLIGMLLVAFAASGKSPARFGSIKGWTVTGCLLSGCVLFGLASIGFLVRDGSLLRSIVGLMGFANGAFAVAAIGWMMNLANAGPSSREGIRMGLWGGAQAVAFAIGGFGGALGVDFVRFTMGSSALPYATVFTIQGILFLLSAVLASRMSSAKSQLAAHELMAASLSPEDLGPSEFASAGSVGTGGE